MTSIAQPASTSGQINAKPSAAATSALTLINTILHQLRASREPTRTAPRVSQLDAQLLDAEVYSLLNSQLRRALRLVAPALSGASSSWSLELDCGMHLLLNHFTVLQHRSTPGGQLQNLKWASTLDLPATTTILDSTTNNSLKSPQPRITTTNFDADDEKTPVASTNSSSSGTSPSLLASSLQQRTKPRSQFPLSTAQRFGYGVVSVLLRYAWLRWQHHMLAHDWGHSDEVLQFQLQQQISDDSASNSFPRLHFAQFPWRYRVYLLCRYAEHSYRLASFVNLLLFLYSGRYVTLWHRLLRITHLSQKPAAQRQVSFDYMNQSLAWSHLSEFALFFLPFVRFDLVSRLWTSMSRSIFGQAEAVRNRIPSGQQEDDLGAESTSGEPHQHTCPLCDSTPCVMPHVAQCGHVFCYYCLGCARLNDRAFQCPECKQTVTQQKPFMQTTT